ncbi:hypothetical protein FRB99_005644 [Tulasnella sp. 403]|nr:hypothetical protein FRB99_005644 [Tulasnella sp. 403]
MALPQSIPHQHHARQLSRLNIPGPGFNEVPVFNPQQFPPLGAQHQLPQSAFVFSGNPMQQQQQQAQQQRQLGHGSQPSLSMHRSRPSLAIVPGFMPGMPPGPLTAVPHTATNFGGFPAPPTPGAQQQFPGHPPHFRPRRNQSISIGGPPKALLGGPQKKPVTPTPGTITTLTTEGGKVKKVNVRLPKETIDTDEVNGESGPVASSSRSRPSWARNPLPLDSIPPQIAIPPEVSSVEIYPEQHVATDDEPAIALPPRNAWELYRNAIIEEKLAKLGVEPSGYPPIGTSHVPTFAPIHHHARASSVSTPADPALLARHGLAGQRQTPSPLTGSHPLSNPPAGGQSAFPPQQQRSLAAPFSFGGPAPQAAPAPPRFPPQGSSGARPYHGHSMSLVAPTFTPPNPYLSPGGFSVGSTNPFGSGAVLGGGDGSQAASLSVTPQPSTSLASVSEYEEEGAEDSGESGGMKIHAPKPVGMLHLRPVFVSHQSSPAQSATASLREPEDVSAPITPPVTAVAPAKTLTSTDFMRGFGIEDVEEEADAEGAEPESVDAAAAVSGRETMPIVDEVQRGRLIAEEDGTVAGATPTTARFPPEVTSEAEAIENEVNAVDPAEDADEEDVDREGEADVEGETEPEDARDNYTTPSHSRHVSKVSMAPSLAEMGASHGTGIVTQRNIREFRFGGRPNDQVQEETEDAENGAGQQVVYLNEEVDEDVPEEGVAKEWTGQDDIVNPQNLHGAADLSDDESIGEWSNPSDEERARAERRERRLLREAQAQAFHTLNPLQQPDHDNSIRSDASFVSNPSNEARQSEDIISNPSDDEYGVGGMTFGGGVLQQATSKEQTLAPGYYTQIGAGIEFNAPVQRPLPPLPHSRDPSLGFPQTASPAQSLSNHQSPAPSVHTATPLVKGHRTMPSTGSLPRSDLNPLARPFVFGTRPGSNSFNLQSPSTEAGSVPPAPQVNHKLSHSRQLSVNTKLNVAAPEFKPSGAFAFTPIAGVPTKPFPLPPTTSETSRPLPQPPIPTSPLIAAQGREKRPRMGSPGKLSNEQAAFQFPRPRTTPPPPAEEPIVVVEEEKKIMERRDSVLNVHAKPFTFAGLSLSASKTNVPLPSLEAPRPASYPEVPSQCKSEQPSPPRISTPQPDPTPKAVSMPTSAVGSPPTESLALPQSNTTAFGRPLPQRMPIPDFSHPVSTNTLPAGVFKALAQGDGDGTSKSSVREPRLGSKDYFEHASRRSLDDLNVLSISKNLAGKRIASAAAPLPIPTVIVPEPTAPALALAPPPRSKERRSSAPTQVVEVPPPEPSPVAASDSMFSSMLHKGSDLDVEQLESRVEAILEEKLNEIRDEISLTAITRSKESDAVVNAAIGQLVASFRAQMVEHMKKVTESTMSRADAHVELDFDLIKAAIEEGHHSIRASVIQDVTAAIERLREQPVRPAPPMEVLHAIEDLRGIITDAVTTSTQTLVSRVDDADGYAHRRTQEERQLMIRELTALLLPRIAALRPEPFDIDAVTRQLSEAVKPRISQLIDLASDKKETAVLIVQQLTPLLHSLVPPRLDIPAIATQLTRDVLQHIPPTDPHVLKEQVADLVIERLDSRLAIRDSALSPEAIATRLAKVIAPLTDLANLPSAPSVEALNKRQDSLFEKSNDVLARQDTLTAQLGALPEAISAATDLLRTAHSDLTAKAGFIGELEELRKLATVNADLQTQLGKARSAHGQVRSEKDLLSDRLQSVEHERDLLRAELEAVKLTSAAREAEITDAQGKATATEDALNQALDRLKSFESSSPADKRQIGNLEQQNRDLQKELHQCQTKIKTMELEATFAARDLDAAGRVKEELQEEIDRLREDKSHFDDLRRTAEQVETLSRLIGAADTEEVAELRRIRDKSKGMEREYTSLQKRCADQEAKISALLHTSAANKQSIAETKQKIAEWEKRARRAEGELDSTQTQLEQARDIQDQLQVDVSSLREELEAKTTALAAIEGREQTLMNKVASLESQLVSARVELQGVQPRTNSSIHAPRPQVASSTSWQQKNIAVPNGRPGSSTSTIGVDISRPGTATPNGNGSPTTPPASSMWSSVKSSKKLSSSNQKPQSYLSHSSSFIRSGAPSPTPSVVSVAATEQADGWWM